MTTTNKDKARWLREVADDMRARGLAFSPEALAAEADRLDPPAPTGKTVTWNSNPYRMAERGIEYQLEDGRWIYNTTREFIDAVVLPLLADAPDGPIPDETVERAWRVYACIDDEVSPEVVEKERPNGMHYMRAALEAVRGLPGMAVVRAGKPPEVLRWEVWDKDGERIVRCGTRETAREFIRQYHEDDVVRVVAVIADPGEGTP